MPDFETQLHDRLARIEARADAEAKAVHTKIDALLQGVYALLLKDPTMSKIADDIKALTSDIATLATDNTTKTGTLIGFKDESDASLSDVVTALTTARDTMKDTGAKLDDALAAHAAADAATSAAQGTPVS